jgi:hypothetical protein
MQNRKKNKVIKMVELNALRNFFKNKTKRVG